MHIEVDTISSDKCPGRMLAVILSSVSRLIDSIIKHSLLDGMAWIPIYIIDVN